MPDQVPITPAELDAIEARAAAATPGPWCLTFVNPEGFPDLFLDAAKTVDITIEDLNFIDSARTDVPRLVAEVRRIRNALMSVRTEIDAGEGIEVYCDVNPEDCGHCCLLGFIDQVLEGRDD